MTGQIARCLRSRARSRQRTCRPRTAQRRRTSFQRRQGVVVSMEHQRLSSPRRHRPGSRKDARQTRGWRRNPCYPVWHRRRALRRRHSAARQRKSRTTRSRHRVWIVRRSEVPYQRAPRETSGGSGQRAARPCHCVQPRTTSERGWRAYDGAGEVPSRRVTVGWVWASCARRRCGPTRAGAHDEQARRDDPVAGPYRNRSRRRGRRSWSRRWRLWNSR